MTEVKTVFYKAETQNKGYAGFISQNNFYLVFFVEGEISGDQGNEMVSSIKNSLVTTKIENMSQFELFVISSVKKANLPANFSAASGFIKNNILYIKTFGKAQICVVRDDKLISIIEGENVASGYISAKDLYIFSTTDMLSLYKKNGNLSKIIHEKDLQKLSQLPPLPINSLFLLIGDEMISVPRALPSQPVITKEKYGIINTVKHEIANLKAKFEIYSLQLGKKKTYTFVAIVILIFILIWSVGFGYMRRSGAAADQKIKSSTELITQKLSQAQEVVFLNLARSQALISEARQELDKLKKEVGKGKEKELGQLETLIDQKEGGIVKKEEKPYEEFFDLTVDSKDASGKKLYLDADNLSIIDSTGGRIYVLSITKKSLDKKSSSTIKAASIVAANKSDSLFFTKDGVYKIGDDGKTNKVIDADKDWGEVKDMFVYNGNLYLLDVQKDDVYKYLPADNGYSSKNSYFQKGESISIKGANSLAIDSSLYIGFDNNIVKYTGGVKDDFATAYPQKNIQLNKVFTTKDLEKVYSWDKKNGSVYILGKNGTYERQVQSNVLSSADDIAVYNNIAYVLKGVKIYSIDLK
jgi:hypothetical protein